MSKIGVCARRIRADATRSRKPRGSLADLGPLGGKLHALRANI